MSLTIAVTAGKTLARSERANNAKLNALGLPTLALSGTASTAQLGDNTVTAVKGSYGPWFYCTDGGTANAHSLTAAASATTLPTSLVAGQEFAYTAAATNTGAVTVAISGIAGTKALTKNGTTALVAGDVRAGQLVWVRYDGTQFQLASPNGQPNGDRFATTGGTATAYTATFAPTLTALTNGARVLVKWNATNTGAATFAPDGLTAKAITKLNDSALVAGDVLANQISELVYDSTLDHWLLTSPVVINTPATVVGLSRGLVIKNNTGLPNQKLDITADDVVLKNASDLSYLAATVSVTLDISASVGANGPDATLGGSGWQYIWLIYNGTTVASLFSTSATAPTLPTGYTYKALLGACYATTGAPYTLQQMYQSGRRAAIATTASTSTADVAGSWTAVAGVTTILPPIATFAFGSAGASTAFDGLVSLAGNSGGTMGLQTVAGRNGAPTISSYYWAGPYEVPMPTAQTFYYLTNAAGTYRITVSGYSI